MHLVLVPTYNEYQNIRTLLDALCVIPDVHVLVIDDASPDGTAEEVKSHAFFLERVFLLERKGKEGLGAAYRAGFAWGFEKGYYTLTQMDADFSHDPQDLPRLLAEVMAGADVAIGSRKIPGGEIVGWGPWRTFCSSGAMGASRLCLGLKTRDVTAGFRTWKRSFVEQIPVLSLKSNGYAFQEEMILVAELRGAQVKEVPVIFRDRIHGTSKLGFKDVREFFYTLSRLTAMRRKRFLVYILIGGVGALIDLGGFLFLHQVVGLSLLPANIIATSIAVIHNFLFHHYVTFKEHEQVASVAFARFVGVSLVGIALNSIIVLAGVGSGMLPAFAKVLAIVCVTLWNYLMNARVTFKV
ncbi:glycosyltransferase family 2 protein [bacterium]|nr:glycosyltransferase family 2 protein [bacterium]NBX49635.1 glycosyltransferase family 2 protein [bacterium]